jgi:replicative DNA helicase
VERLRTLGPRGKDVGLVHAALQGVGYSSPSSSPGVRLMTGFDDVDRITGGGLPTGVHLLSGEPGSGRTGLAVTLALHAASTGHPVLVVCKADDSLAFAQRLVSGHTRIDRAKLVENVDPYGDALANAAEYLAGLPILVAETERLEPWTIGWTLRELTTATTKLPALVIVDDLDQLCPPDDPPSFLRQVGRSLGDLARAVTATIVLTTAAQLGRDSDGARRRPTRQDANGWATLAPYLRSAWLLFRDEMHDEDSRDAGIGELILAWQASGPTGTVRLAHLPHLGVWANLHRQPLR